MTFLYYWVKAHGISIFRCGEKCFVSDTDGSIKKTYNQELDMFKKKCLSEFSLDDVQKLPPLLLVWSKRNIKKLKFKTKIVAIASLCKSFDSQWRGEPLADSLPND